MVLLVSCMKLLQYTKAEAACEMDGPSVKSAPPLIRQGGTLETPRPVCQLPLLQRSRSLEPRAGRELSVLLVQEDMALPVRWIQGTQEFCLPEGH